MKSKASKNLSSKKLIVFDIDGTLTPSKAPADQEMIRLLLQLLKEKVVAVIGGGKYTLFQEQLISRMPKRDARLERLFLFPTSSTTFYRFSRGRWQCVYEHVLSVSEKKKIKQAFKDAFRRLHYVPPEKVYGPTIEDRKTQISFSPLGQEIVAVLGKKGIAAKEAWYEKHNKLRARMARALGRLLPEFKVRVGGLTTIDVTKKGIDKAYGIRTIRRELSIPIRDMLFVGDAIFPGGNDYAVVKTGVDYVKVKGPEDTKKVIRFLLKR